MLETRKDLKDKIEAHAAEITDLESQLETLTTERDDAREENARLSEQLAESAEALAALRKDHETAIAEQAILSTKVTVLEEELANEPDRLAEEAARQLAESGHEAIEEAGKTTLTREEFDAQYSAIEDGRERAAWYLKNKHLIGR